MKNLSLLLLLLGSGVFTDSVAEPPKVSLTVKVQGDGIVTSNPAGINCPPTCAASFDKSSTIILTATADINSSLLGWEGACIDSSPTCEVNLTLPAFALAVFETVITTSPTNTPKTGLTVSWTADHNRIAGE